MVTIKEYFNRTADYYYTNYVVKELAAHGLNQKYVTHLMPLVQGKRALEIGSGPGTFLDLFSHDAKLLVGIDFSWQMLHIAQVRGPAVSLVMGDAARLPFKDGAIEVVYCIRTMQHIPCYQSVLREIQRILHANGILVFDFINRRNPCGFLRGLLSGHGTFVYLRADSRASVCKALFEAGFECRRMQPLQFLLDASNIRKYFPGALAKTGIRWSELLEEYLQRKVFIEHYALRYLVIAQRRS